MLQSISWSQYFLFLLTVSVIYYLFIWLVYFKAKLPFLAAVGKNNKAFQGEDQRDEVISNAQYILDEVRPVFKGKKNKTELIYSLQSHLTKYNQWDEPGFRDTINDFIIKESEQQCSIHLSEEDLRVLWL